jgi:pimeloyl-ACP methyl ester carboxylesterase
MVPATMGRAPASRGKIAAAGAVAAGIAAIGTMALAVQRQTQEAERLNPPQGQFIHVDGVKLHFTDSGGSGSAVVLLHGNGAMIADLEISGLIDQLKARHRVIAFDRPGYGYSERPRGRTWTPRAQADLFRKALAQLEIQRPAVFGHSWGTLVALSLAIEYPMSVAGLVLASGYYYPSARADVVALSTPAVPVLGDALRYTIAPLIGWGIAPKAIAKMFAPLPVTESFKREFPVAMALRPAQLRASAEEAGIMVPSAAALQHDYRKIEVPVTIIAGEDDEIVDTAMQSIRLHEDIPGSRLIVVPEAGHMIHHFERDQVADAISEMAGRSAVATADAA